MILFGQECSSCSKFYYKLTQQTDSLNKNSKLEFDFVLIKKNDSLLFSQIENMKADSLEAIIWKNYTANNSSSISFKGLPKAKFKYYISKNLNDTKSSLQVIDKIGTHNFIYNDDAILNWELHQEKKNIAGFTCQKATVKAFGKNFIAWFTSEIPISDGPYKFRGLPGLIVEIYDDEQYFNFSLVRYAKNQNEVSLSIPSFRKRKLITTTKDKFLKAKDEYREGLIARIKNSVISESVSEQRIKQLQEEQKNNNTHLESTY